MMSFLNLDRVTKIQAYLSFKIPWNLKNYVAQSFKTPNNEVIVYVIFL